KGFVKTGQDLRPADLTAWPLQRPPLLLETSVPGIFAVGDVRAGSVKRVASAVGEGSICVQLVHRVLAEGGEDERSADRGEGPSRRLLPGGGRRAARLAE